ncbi:hypothetical protein BN7_4094 [Wickerhamomyces ciferrii]|uniref:HTH APSES-type domain-containing protein n=1 Tax=Wickerhamomyces ciferrii (strain ATCC 14091 / BCRC 22168 / CBS 111 / JCM 3599 / NBRC 0793 / NRRL Y-1031 F-60-10) TaxID=1206466 RepID=K0KT28_WICCF|nr:uncharacterized protein BN7_4094 [Wickerhamomyces ciferrii]CCH44529.1 hypothetical protein BN7_4094 [Wickerhamomyces ciferrii]
MSQLLTYYIKDEFYVYPIGGTDVIRKKINSWVNLYSLFPLIDVKDEYLVEKVEDYPTTHAKTQKTTPPRFYGVYAPLETARAFAEFYGISDMVAPILSFNRVALVTYMGSLFYEYFAASHYDSHIRILRECNENESERINMDQVFVAYRKHKEKDAIPELERSFHTYFDDILKKGDATLCGGSWVKKDVVKKFTKKHGFFNLLSPIIDFEGNDPSTGSEYAVDIIQRELSSYWKVTSSDDSFYGFPLSFKGGNAPNRPKNNSRNFPFSQLCAEKRLNVETTKENQSHKRALTLLRRLSDGFVNVSYLVSICVLLKLNDLNLGKEDPDLLIANELYQRDQLEKLPCEKVVTSASKYANGYWCSITVARNLFGTFHIKKENNERRKVYEFLYSPDFQRIEKDTDGTLLSAKSKVEEDSDDDMAPINENDFREMQNNEKEPIYYDQTFFEDNAPETPEDIIAPANFNDYIDGQKDESQGEEDDVIFQGDHTIQQDGDEEDDDADLPTSRKRRRHHPNNTAFDSSDDENSSSSGKRQKSSGMFVDEEEEELEQLHNPTNEEEQGDDDSLFGNSQPSTGQPEETSNEKEQVPPIDQRLSNLEREERIEETSKELKDLAFKINQVLGRKDLNSKRSGLELKGHLELLNKFRAIDDRMLTTTNIKQALNRAKAIANAFARQVDSALKRWNQEVADGQLPGKPGDPPKRENVNNYDRIRPSKVPPPPPTQPYGRRPFANEAPPIPQPTRQGPPPQAYPYGNPPQPRQPQPNGPPQRFGNRPPVPRPGGYNYGTTAPPPPNSYPRGGPIPPNPNTRAYPNQYNAQQGAPPPPQPQPQPRFANQPQPPPGSVPGQPIHPGHSRPIPPPNYGGANIPPPQPNQPNFRGSPPMRNPIPQRHQPAPRVSPNLLRPQPSQPIFIPPASVSSGTPPIPPPQPIPMGSPHHQQTSGIPPPNPGVPPPAASQQQQSNRQNTSGGASPNLSFLPQVKHNTPTGPPPVGPSSSTPTSDHYQPGPGPNSTIPNPQSRYRERPPVHGQTYIAPPGQRPVPSSFSNGYKRTGPSTSASPKNKQKDASNTILKDIQRPLSPPSNYLNLPNEPLDIIDIALQDYKDMVNEAKSKTEEEELSRLDEFNELKKLTHFETRTKQDLFKRAKAFYENEKRRVGFTKRLHAMMSEAYTRRQKLKSKSKA